MYSIHQHPTKETFVSYLFVLHDKRDLVSFTLYSQCLRRVPNPEGSVKHFLIDQHYLTSCHFLPLSEVSSACLRLLHHMLEVHQQPRALMCVGEGSWVCRSRSCGNPTFLYSWASEETSSGGPPGPLACIVCSLALSCPERLVLGCSPMTALHSTQVAPPDSASFLHGPHSTNGVSCVTDTQEIPTHCLIFILLPFMYPKAAYPAQ